MFVFCHFLPLPSSSYILIRDALSQSPCGHEYSAGEAAAPPAVWGLLARGSPESTPCYLSIWALSAPPNSRTRGGRGADLLVHSATPIGAASSHVQEYLLVSPSVWGRKSQRGLAGAAEPGAASPPLKQWEPALIGKSQQDRGSTPKKDKANFHSIFHIYIGGRDGGGEGRGRGGA